MNEIKCIAKKERAEKRKNRGNRDFSDLLECLKNTAIMLVIAVVAGGILGLVYEVTKEPIAVMEAKEEENANRKAMYMASGFNAFEMEAVDFTNEKNQVYATLNSCLEAYGSNGELIGYVLKITSHEGYGGDISFSMGILVNGTISGVSITDISETAGLGMRAEEVLIPQFAGRYAQPFTVVKRDSPGVFEISAITSATITSNAVTNAVNAGIEYYTNNLNGGVLDE